MIYFLLALLGLCAGSFVNAWVWRTHKQFSTKSKLKKYSITKGRSVCVHCGRQLKWIDLIPVLSWLSLKGKCRYCHKAISKQYPFVEIIVAIIFVISYTFWPHNLTSPSNQLFFATWLISIPALVSLFIYDLKWMLLPNKIVLPTFLMVSILSLIGVIIAKDFGIILQLLTAVAVGGGIFYILFRLSNGKWIGGGDVKLGFLLGLLCGTPFVSMLMLFIASLLGCFYALPSLLAKKIKYNSKIPFGPFLISATAVAIIWGPPIIN